MLFGVMGRVQAKNGVLDWVQIPHGKGEILGEMTQPNMTYWENVTPVMSPLPRLVWNLLSLAPY